MILLCLLLGAQAATRELRWTLEDSDEGFSPVDPDGQWEWGSFPTDYGPAGGFTGASGWATRLDGAYFNEVEAQLSLPAYPLGDLGQPMLEIVHWYEMAEGDVVNLVYVGGSGLEVIDPVYSYPIAAGYSGSSGGWVRSWFDLDGISDTSAVALHLLTDRDVQMSGWYVDELSLWDGDVAPPKVSQLTALPDTEDVDGPYLVQVYAVDNDGQPGVSLLYQIGDGSSQAVPMSALGGGWFEAEISGPVEPGTEITYQVRASDGENVVLEPADAPRSFEVRLLPPTGLRGPEGRIVDTEAELVWDAPESIHAVEGYRVLRGEEALFEVEGRFALVPLVGGGEDSYAVQALYEVGESGPSEPLSLQVSLPEVLSLSPSAAYQGDTVRVTVTGQYLLLSEGEVDAELGVGVEVVDVEVSHVDEAVLVLEVAEDAPLGTRNLELSSGDVLVRVTEAFVLLDGAARPQLTGIEPDALRQGDARSVVITASEPFEDLPLIDLGPGVLVEEVSLLSDSAVEVQVVVEPTAAIGQRPVTVDDGARVWEGVQLRVRDAVPNETGRCQSGAGAPWMAGAVLGLLAALRRRRR
ncbi:MAG: hypothetical protein H6741_03345 [Alphaproteobacteria bacterium]|nr:hypothetical protein [Alphaproteobacteria bacterium]